MCIKLFLDIISNFYLLNLYHLNLIPERQTSDQLKEPVPAADLDFSKRIKNDDEEIYTLHVCNTEIFKN